jgi:hypothetical protein
MARWFPKPDPQLFEQLLDEGGIDIIEIRSHILQNGSYNT